jgi:hypothetical protein
VKLRRMVNPVVVTKRALGVAGWTVGVAVTVVGDTAHVVKTGLRLLGNSDQQGGAAGQTDWEAAAEPHVEGVPREPTVVPVEPHAPEEPPIDVVGQALAAEAELGTREIPEGAGLAHEPRGASRDEEHGDAPLRRAEAEGIAEEVTAALEDEAGPDSGPLPDHSSTG